MGEKVIVNIKTFTDGYKPLDRVIPAMPWSHTVEGCEDSQGDSETARSVVREARNNSHCLTVSRET